MLRGGQGGEVFHMWFQCAASVAVIHPCYMAHRCLLVCQFCNLECTAISCSDFWLFPGFCFFFHILFIFSTCIRCLQVSLLWECSWAWNAWWWWHVGFFMQVFSWTTLHMKMETMSYKYRARVPCAGGRTSHCCEGGGGGLQRMLSLRETVSSGALSGAGKHAFFIAL